MSWFQGLLDEIAQKYKELNQKERNKAFLLAWKNNRMGNGNHGLDEEYDACLRKYEEEPECRFFEKCSFECREDIIAYYHDLLSNMKKQYSDLYEIIVHTNIALYCSDMCPILAFAFHEWKLPYDFNRKDVLAILEFSYMGLLRCIDYRMGYLDKKCISTGGAVFDIYVDEEQDGNIRKIYKQPKTFASYYFLAEKEYEIASILKNTTLKKFLCSGYEFDYNTKVIKHDFIEGMSGEEYLFNHREIRKVQIESLREFYENYQKLSIDNLVLDVHPGNFVWNEDKMQWYIIDCGNIPFIGKEYYEYQRFEDYFSKIWIEREETIKKIPIRSFDCLL